MRTIVKNKKTVFVAMSGGVDSSVAALLLKRQGYGVVGVFMRCFNLDGCAERDAEDARRVAEKLKIPFYVWDFEKEYKKKVVEYMVKGYKKGITPNPDVMCNREIKFGIFLKKALQMGADFVATGHYIKIQNSKFKIQNDNSKFKIIYKLFQAKDKNKDQSYFLWALIQAQLKHCLFPIGDYLKPKVREIARKAGLPTAEKKDSQGICFLGKISLEDFLKQYIPKKQGDVLDVFGKKIGKHKGAHFYTIGQRHGLGIGGSEKPYYVVEKNVKKNIIVVAEGDDNSALYKKRIELTDVNFINQQLLINNQQQQVLMRVRYRQPLINAVLRQSALKSASIRALFEKPQKAVAPGQSAVFYNKAGEMLGGGTIDKIL
ncbi:MAG: tRNA 2-thiouridine(34) synthase MnmA [Patescibacteria group bacterium]